MIARRLEDISFEDLSNLLQNEVRENKTLEYKRQLPHEGDSAKLPFLAEVCALANTDGGDLIFGIDDEKGSPKELTGLSIDDPDKEILRIESAIRTGIEPRIPNISSKVIRGNAKIFLIVRVARSWNAPHRVIFKDHAKFYKRNSAGKYSMDVSELRMAFVQSEQIVDRIRNFRRTRLEKLKAEHELPVNLHSGAKLALHLVPLVAFSQPSYLSFDKRDDTTLSLRPMGSSGWNRRYNLDGLVSYARGRDDSSISYTQIFRNGVIEAVSSIGWYDDRKCIASQAYEREFIQGARSYLKTYSVLDIEAPIFFFISLVGIKDYTFAVSQRLFFLDDRKASDRDDLILPEGRFASLDEDPEKVFQPFFDMIWNAYDFERSFNYDDNGNWVGQQ